MEPLIDQPTAIPTRKLLMGAAGSLITVAVQHGAAQLAGDMPAFVWLTDPLAMQALPILAFGLVGYLFRDRA